MKKIAILGASGSIGTSTLDVIRNHPDKFSLVAFSVYSNVSKIETFQLTKNKWMVKQMVGYSNTVPSSKNEQTTGSWNMD